MKSRFVRFTELTLAVIFGYSVFSKISNFASFQLKFSKISIVYSLDIWWFSYVIVLTECVIALAFVFQIVKKANAYLTLITLIVFTSYLSTKLIGNDPEGCSCGGIFNFLDIKQHLIVNVLLMGMACYLLFAYDAEKGETHPEKTVAHSQD